MWIVVQKVFVLQHKLREEGSCLLSCTSWKTSYVVSDVECVIRVAIVSVNPSGKPFVPLWEYFLFQLSDVMMRPYACLMAMWFGSLEIWILFSLPYLVDFLHVHCSFFAAIWFWCGLVVHIWLGLCAVFRGIILLAMRCVRVSGRVQIFGSCGIILCSFLLFLLRILKINFWKRIELGYIGLLWSFFGTWVPLLLILFYCVLVISCKIIEHFGMKSASWMRGAERGAGCFYIICCYLAIYLMDWELWSFLGLICMLFHSKIVALFKVMSTHHVLQAFVYKVLTGGVVLAIWSLYLFSVPIRLEDLL